MLSFSQTNAEQLTSTNSPQDNLEIKEEDLKERKGKLALSWVKERNKETLAAFGDSSLFEKIKEESLIAGRNNHFIPPVLHEGYLYQFLQDATYKKGLFRRISLNECKNANGWENLFDMSVFPEAEIWETLIDKDNHQNYSNEEWVFHSPIYCPNSSKILIRLSLSAQTKYMYREFDVDKKEFVKDGFNIYEGQFDIDQIKWWDNNSLLLSDLIYGGDLAEGKKWRYRLLHLQRGESLNIAKQIYHSVDYFSLETYPTNNTTYVIAKKYLDNGKRLLLLFDIRNGHHQPLPIPADTERHCFFQSKLIITLTNDWKINNDKNYLSGSVIAVDINSISDESTLKTELVFSPSTGCAVRNVKAGTNYLLIEILNNVNGEIHRFEHKNGNWISLQLPLPTKGSVNLLSESVITYENFLMPFTFYFYDDAKSHIRILRSDPQKFDTENLEIFQDKACSQDGTLIPYYVVHPKSMKYNGCNATLIYGYGGFETSLVPEYKGVIGKLWLEQGGVYVVANIRGGCEFGPAWHDAATKENRHKTFEDFYAVSCDLITKKITSPEHLGIWGRSNGGLLVSAVFTQYPELYKLVIAEMPVTDMLDKENEKWKREYGDNTEEKTQEYLKTYSPYQNLSKEKTYPSLMFFSAVNDKIVHPFGPRKMVHKLKNMEKDVFYYENNTGGHTSEGDVITYATQMALLFSFARKKLMDNIQILTTDEFKHVKDSLDALLGKEAAEITVNFLPSPK